MNTKGGSPSAKGKSKKTERKYRPLHLASGGGLWGFLLFAGGGGGGGVLGGGGGIGTMGIKGRGRANNLKTRKVKPCMAQKKLLRYLHKGSILESSTEFLGTGKGFLIPVGGRKRKGRRQGRCLLGPQMGRTAKSLHEGKKRFAIMVAMERRKNAAKGMSEGEKTQRRGEKRERRRRAQANCRGSVPASPKEVSFSLRRPG